MQLKHLPGLIKSPVDEWQAIRKEKPSISNIYFTLVIILGAIAPVCGFIGTTMVGWSVADGPVIKLTSSSAIKISILFYIAILIAVFAIGCMIKWMGDTYGFSRSLARCVQLSALVASPLMMLGVFLLFSEVWIIYLIGLPVLMYSVYLLYSGVPIMLDIPKEKGFLLSSAILAVGLVTLVGLLASTAILWGMGIAPSFTN